MATDTAAGAKAETAEEESDRGGEEERDEEEAQGEEEAPTHLPLAPPYALDDVSTVDPSYIISLIRNLLPGDEKKQDAIGDCSGVKETTAAEASEDLGSHGDLTRCSKDNGDRSSVGQENPSALSQDNEKCQEIQLGSTYNCDRSSVDQENPSALGHDGGKSQELLEEEERNGALDHVQAEAAKPFKTQYSWEECGCTLWDLSATRAHAKFMVDNLFLEVLLASLRVSKSLRVKEICLGIIGNLACHDDLSNAIVSKDGLVEIVVQQLFLDDPTCLSVTFRLLAAGLQGNMYNAWADALVSDQVLLRILWIIGNTLNYMLLEKCIEFLMAIISNQEISSFLLRRLIKLGLPDVVTGLVAGELSKLGDASKLERSSNLEPVLALVELLSTTDSFSQVISSNKELLPLICGLVKLRDKIEVAGPCASATVILANLLEEDPDLALQFKEDFFFLFGLFEFLPFVSDDPNARNAFWCIMQRILSRVEENDVSSSTLLYYQWVFASKCRLIEEDMKNHPDTVVKSPENHSTHFARKSSPAATSIRRIACIIEKWIYERSLLPQKGLVGGSDGYGGQLHRLLHYCRKYGSN